MIMELFLIWNVFWLCVKDLKVELVVVMFIIVIGLIYIILGGID